MGLLAKVNLALEAITKIFEEKEKEDEHEYRRVMNLGVLPGPRSLNSIPDLVVQDVSEVVWGEERFDEDEDETDEVGDIKLHSGWKHNMWKHVDSRDVNFRQLLSQVNFYITQNVCQYGFVVTEREVVAVYRPGRKGLLKLSESFPIRTRIEGLGQGEGEGTYPPSSPMDLCADKALLALILWAADPPSPATDLADEICDAEAEEDEYYPNIEAVAFSSDGPTSAEKGSDFSFLGKKLDNLEQGVVAPKIFYTNRVLYCLICHISTGDIFIDRMGMG